MDEVKNFTVGGFLFLKNENAFMQEKVNKPHKQSCKISIFAEY